MLMMGHLAQFDLFVFGPAILASNGLLWRSLMQTDINDKEQCNTFFQRNRYYGLCIFFSILMGSVYKQEKLKKKSLQVS
jgi:4-hydroxybenzoate polyprenyltransferase